MDRDQGSLRRAAGSGGMETTNAAVGKGVSNSQSLQILGINGQTKFRRYIVFEVPGTLFITIAGSRRRVKRSRAIGHTSGQRIGQTILIPETKSSIFSIPDFWRSILAGIATNSRVLRDNLQKIDVDVITISPERLHSPHDSQIPVHIPQKFIYFVSLISIGHEDKVEPLTGWPGHLVGYEAGTFYFRPLRWFLSRSR